MEKIALKDVLYEFFVKSFIPMAVARAKDGTYVAVNKSAIGIAAFREKES